MADETFDHRYASIDKVHALETRVAVIESDIRNQLTNIQKQNDRIEQRMSAAPSSHNNPSIDGLTLAMQRMMDAMPKQAGRGGNNVGWVIGFCGVACVAGYLALKMVFG